MSRRTSRCAAAIATALCLAGCGGADAKLETIRLGFSPAIDYLPFFVMLQRGLDRKAGLRVETVPYAGGAVIADRLAAGDIDAGFVGTIPLIAAVRRGETGSSIVAVAAGPFAGPAHPAGAVLVHGSVADWKSLEGAYVAVNAPTSLGAWAAAGRFRSEGVHTYSFVNIGFENMGLAVGGGDVKAAVMFEPYITQSLLRGDGKVLDWVIGGPPLSEIQVSSLVYSRSFLRDRPREARSFLRAYVQAVRRAIDREGEARRALGRGLAIVPAVSQRMRLAEWRADCRNDPVLLRTTQETLMDLGFLTDVIPPSSLYDETLLDAVLKELGTRQSGVAIEGRR